MTSSALPPWISSDGDGGSRLSVRAAPGSKRSSVEGPYGDSLRIRLAAPPREGKANRALVDLLATLLGLPRRRVELVSGSSSRDKGVRVVGLAPDEVVDRLGALPARR
jgi:uncharacterized protein